MEIEAMMTNIAKAYDRLQLLDIKASRNNILILDFVQSVMKQTFDQLEGMQKQSEEVKEENGSV